LPLAVIFKIDIHKQIREAFARFCQLDILEVDADIFTAALNNNNSVLARKNNGQTITVKEVLLGFLQLIDNQRNIDNYLKSLDLVASDVENVRIVLNLYNDLITNKIWLELDHSLCAHKKIEKIKVDPLAEYLKIIEETADLSGWLEDYKNVASWLADKDEKFIRNIFKILQSKINLGDQKLADNLLLLIEELHGQGRGNIEVIYYDDVSGKIKWNEEYLK
jgi:hypothetical protein